MKLTLRQPGSHRCEELTSSTLFQACPRGPTSFLLGCRPEISIASRDQIFNRGQHCREVPRQHPSASFVGAAATATAEARTLSSWFPGCPCPESSRCLALLIPFHSTASYDAFPARAQWTLDFFFQKGTLNGLKLFSLPNCYRLLR